MSSRSNHFFPGFRRGLLLLGLALAAAAPAATEFENGLVPMEVVRDFAGGTVYRSLPDGFPPISLPAGLDLRLSGSTSEGYSQRLVLRTKLHRDALNQQLLAALTQQGWLDLSPGYTYALRLCHEQYGTLFISMNGLAGTAGDNKVEVSRSTYPAQRTCSEELATSEASANWYNFFSARFPQTTLPPGTTNEWPPQSSSDYNASGYFKMGGKATLEVPATTPAALHEHFATQIREQGWQADSSSSGERSAASIWTRTFAAPAWSDTDVTMVVELSVIRGAGAVYGVSLTLQSLPAPGGWGQGIIGVYPF